MCALSLERPLTRDALSVVMMIQLPGAAAKGAVSWKCRRARARIKCAFTNKFCSFALRLTATHKWAPIGLVIGLTSGGRNETRRDERQTTCLAGV